MLWFGILTARIKDLALKQSSSLLCISAEVTLPKFFGKRESCSKILLSVPHGSWELRNKYFLLASLTDNTPRAFGSSHPDPICSGMEDLLWCLNEASYSYKIITLHSSGPSWDGMRCGFDMGAQDMIGGSIEKEAIAEKILNGMTKNDPVSGSKSLSTCNEGYLYLTITFFGFRKAIL